MSTELLTKSQVVEQFKGRYGSNKLIMKISERDAERFAAKIRSYKLSFTPNFSSKKERIMCWPQNTIGYQGI